MHKIKLSSIIIKDNRQRQEFDPEAMQELKNSIQDGRLIHAPVLREEDENMVLVAGERRLRAIEEIFALGGQFIYEDQIFIADDGLVPYSNIGELSELEAEEAELDENFRRKNLTWQEHAAAVARLHKLRQAQNEAAFEEAAESGKFDGMDASQIAAIAPKHTIADTAEELTGRRDGSYQDTVRTELLVAKHLDNPAIAKAKDAKEALKILKREEEREKNIKLAETVGASFNAEKHTILNQNCLDYMVDPANHGKFDVILTDPPYGMGANEFGDGGGKLSGIEHHYDDSYESWQTLMGGKWKFGKSVVPGWCDLSFKVAKPQAHAYVFCDFDRFHELKKYMERAGWYVFRTPFVVHKVNSGRVPLPECGPRRQYEIILYAIKGNKPVTHIYPDVIASTADENMTHGAQKPVAVYQNLLQRSVRPGDSIADFFAGSGTILSAGHTYKCDVTAIEANPEYYALCLKRVEELKKNDQLGLVF